MIFWFLATDYKGNSWWKLQSLTKNSSWENSILMKKCPDNFFMLVVRFLVHNERLIDQIFIFNNWLLDEFMMKVAISNKKQFIRKFNFNEKMFQQIKIVPAEKETFFCLH